MIILLWRLYVAGYKIPIDNRSSSSCDNPDRGSGISSIIPPTRIVTTTVAVPTAPGAVATQVFTITQVQTFTQAAPAQVMECRLGFAMAVSGPFAVDGPVRRDGGILAIEHINRYLSSIGAPIRFTYVHDDTKALPQML